MPLHLAGMEPVVFKRGDLVRFIGGGIHMSNGYEYNIPGGGPIMVVASNDNDIITCLWLDREWRPQHSTFTSIMLKKEQ